MQVGDIPYTLNGKRVEVPVKKVSLSFFRDPITATYPALGLAGLTPRPFRTRLGTDNMPGLILGLEWGFIGFIQPGHSSEPRGFGRVYWLTRDPSRGIAEGVRETWGLGIGVSRDLCLCV
jgi:hypothetical protein